MKRKSHPARVDQARRATYRATWLCSASHRGAYMPVPVVLRIIAGDCARMQAGQLHDVCGVHLPQLSKMPM